MNLLRNYDQFLRSEGRGIRIAAYISAAIVAILLIVALIANPFVVFKALLVLAGFLGIAFFITSIIMFATRRR